MTTFTRLPRTQLLVGIAILILIAELFANEIVMGDEGDGDVTGWVGLSLVGIALAAVLVLVVVPRLRGQGQRTAVLAFGIGAVLTCVVFWSAIPFALGAATALASDPEEPHRRARGGARAGGDRRRSWKLWS